MSTDRFKVIEVINWLTDPPDQMGYADVVASLLQDRYELEAQLEAVLRECDELESLRVESAFGASAECAARIRAAIKGDDDE